MSSNMIRVTGMNSGLDTESIISAYTSKATKNVQTAKKKLQLNKWTQDAWKDLNSKIYSFYSKTLSTNRLSSAYSKTKTTTSNGALSVSSDGSAPIGVQNAKIISTASAAYMTGGEIEASSENANLTDLGLNTGDTFTYTDKNGTKTFQVGGEASDGVTVVNKLSDITKELSKAGLNANFDAGNKRLFLSAKSTGEGNDFSFGGSVDALAKLGLATEDQLSSAGLDGSFGAAKKIDASSAELELNGVRFKSDSNTLKINNSTYTINYMPTDPNENIAVSTAVDYDGVYDVVKDMLKEYNGLVNEMSKLYNADSAKGYDPLTDEQREAMSEKEIEEWENKIKGSLLRNDDTLSGVLNALTSNINNGIKVGDKTYNLTDFGISTMGYFDAEANERYALHIDGDPDDTYSSGNKDKLKQMLATDPEAVTQFFSKLSANLYDNLYSKMGSTSLSSIYKVYNDKELKTEQTDWEKKVTEYESKLTDMEDKYYRKFAVMEKTLSAMNSRQSSMGAFFG